MFRWPVEIVQMKRNVRMARPELDRLRFNLLKSQLLDAYEKIPFYHAAFRKQCIDPRKFTSLQELVNYPVLTRAEIQKAGPGFLSRNGHLGKIRRSHSSGSTGRPLWISFDANTWFRKKYLSKLRSRFECGIKLNEKVAIFDTASPGEVALRNHNKLFSTPLFKARFFSIFRDTEKQISDLLQWRPQNIDSPPGHIFQLAQALARHRVEPGMFKRIFTSSEYLEPNMRGYIQDRYAAEVYDIYGCTEIKEIAWECERHDGYHINEDEVYVEILSGLTPVKPGEIGDIVLTDLRNKAMPLIRYRIGDRGRLLPGPCSCGRTFSRMAPVAGRSSDFVITPGGQKLSPYQFTTAIEKIDGLLQYQLVQEDIRTIIVKVIMAEGADLQKALEITDEIKGFLVEPMDIKVESCKRINIEENGKFKVVRNKLLEC